jgi:hypothetical protein
MHNVHDNPRAKAAMQTSVKGPEGHDLGSSVDVGPNDMRWGRIHDAPHFAIIRSTEPHCGSDSGSGSDPTQYLLSSLLYPPSSPFLPLSPRSPRSLGVQASPPPPPPPPDRAADGVQPISPCPAAGSSPALRRDTRCEACKDETRDLVGWQRCMKLQKLEGVSGGTGTQATTKEQPTWRCGREVTGGED